jgi:hypothetical protein
LLTVFRCRCPATSHAVLGSCATNPTTLHGEECQLECDTGYTRINSGSNAGNGFRVCLNSQFIVQGTGALLPTCKKDCGATPFVSGTGYTVSCTAENHFGSVCTFAPATDFYKVTGSLVLTCGEVRPIRFIRALRRRDLHINSPVVCSFVGAVRVDCMITRTLLQPSPRASVIQSY